jgi:large subunit ribosomal protein L17
MLANMASSLILHKKINTTVAKAKALRIYVEPLITKSKEDTTHSRRMVFSSLKDKHAVTELFHEVAPKIADRPGGYVRILKTGFRLGDGAEMCFIELVDFNATYTVGKKDEGKAKTRRSRSGAKKEGAEAASKAELAPKAASKTKAAKAEAAPAVEEAPVAEVSVVDEVAVEVAPAMEKASAAEAPAVEEGVEKE